MASTLDLGQASSRRGTAFWYMMGCGAGGGGGKPRKHGILFFLHFSCSVNHSQPEARWDGASVFCREKAGVYSMSVGWNNTLPSLLLTRLCALLRLLTISNEGMHCNRQVLPDVTLSLTAWHCLRWPSGYWSNKLLFYRAVFQQLMLTSTQWHACSDNDDLAGVRHVLSLGMVSCSP